MPTDPKKFEQMIARRVANGVWYLMGLVTAHILIKMSKHEGDDATYGVVILVTLYFCYSFYQKFADAARPHDS